MLSIIERLTSKNHDLEFWHIWESTSDEDTEEKGTSSRCYLIMDSLIFSPSIVVKGEFCEVVGIGTSP